MSILRDVQRLLSLTEQLAPKSTRSSLWRIAAKNALRSAALVETEWKDGDTIGAREGSLEDEQSQDQGTQTTPMHDLTNTLRELLPKRQPVTSPNSKARIKLVPRNPSGPSRRT
jgi:hypothetical protein